MNLLCWERPRRKYCTFSSILSFSSCSISSCEASSC